MKNKKVRTPIKEGRGIPRVKSWLVKFYKDGEVFHSEQVETINKRFAYWLANEQSGYKSKDSDKITVSLIKAPRVPNDPRDAIRKPNANLQDYSDGYQYGESTSFGGALAKMGKTKIKPKSGPKKKAPKPMRTYSAASVGIGPDGRKIQEKAKSKSQQKFMGMVHACQKTGKCASKEVAKTAKSIKYKDAEDFASTKHKGLPEKKKTKTKKKKKLKENVMDKEKKLAVGFINDICDKNYSSARKHLANMVDEKIKARIKRAASSEETVEEKAKPSAGTTKKERSETVKKAKKGEDIGKKGKGFKKVAAKAAKKYGSKKKGEAVAASQMWKNMGKK